MRSPQKRRITHLDAEIIPKFDPGLKSINVKGWLHKIDQLGDLYDWEERDKIFVMQTRLRGAARDWYDDLDDYDATWILWKDRLTKAFPRSSDFVDRLEEMMARVKGNSETMTRYYHDKISLMKKCGIEGEDAISCLIRGLPTELRANAKACCSKTPDELYYGFLSSLENYKKIDTRASEMKSTWQRGSTANMPKICYNCRKTGHTARDCRVTHCQVCQRQGHAANTCWYAAGTPRHSQIQRNQQVCDIKFVSTEVIADLYKKSVTINGHIAHAYVDTGSKVNIITLNLVQIIGLNITHSNVIMRGFGGFLINSLGRTNFKLIIDNLCLGTIAEVTDANLHGTDLIIGQPTINQRGINLLVTSNSVTLLKNTEPISPLSSISLCREDFITKVSLYLSDSVYIQPETSISTNVYTTVELTQCNILITRPVLYSLGQESYFIPQAILTPDNLQISVINLGNSCIKWKPDKLVARAELYLQTDISIITNECNSSVKNQCSQENSILLADLDIGDLASEETNQLLALLNDYKHCFAECSGELGCTDLVEMQITTTSDKPVYCKPYRLPYKENVIVQEKVDELLSAGIVRESNSNYASPTILVKKKVVTIDFALIIVL
jgi:hypothetical protein